MAQRKTNEREIYYGEEGASEGVDPNEGSQPSGSNVIKVTNLMVSPDVSFLGHTGNVTGKIGAQTDPRLSFTVECRGAGAGASNPVPKIDPLLKVVLGRDIGAAPQNYKQLDSGTNITVSSAASASQFNVSGGSFSKGNAIAVETGTANQYEVGWISDMSGSTVTLTKPLLMGQPPNGRKVKPSVTYRPMNSGHQSLTLRVYLEPTTPTNRITFVGCKGSMKFDTPARGTIPTITFNWKAIGWRHETGGTHPTPSYDSATPPSAYKFRVDGADFTTKNASWDLAQTIARKRSQTSTFGTFAQLVTDRSVHGTFDAWDEGESQFSAWTSGTEHEIAHQFGQTEFNMVAYQISKAQRTDVAYSDDNNLTTDLVRFQGNITSGEDEVRLAFL
jgi:hypothetical protein